MTQPTDPGKILDYTNARPPRRHRSWIAALLVALSFIATLVLLGLVGLVVLASRLPKTGQNWEGVGYVYAMLYSMMFLFIGVFTVAPLALILGARALIMSRGRPGITRVVAGFCVVVSSVFLLAALFLVFYSKFH